MSFTKGVSFHHDTSVSSQPTINNNISINASNEVKASNPSITLQPGEVRYSQANVQINEPSTIERENEKKKKNGRR